MAESISPEILGKIFCLVPRATTGKFNSHIPRATQARFKGITFAKVTDLVPLIKVCRYWRDVALGTPFLWSTVLDCIDAQSTPPFIHYIHRCPSGFLFVHCPASPSDALLELLRTEGRRVRAIQLRCDDPYPKERLVKLLSIPLPHLTDCALDPCFYPNEVDKFNIFGGLSTLRTLQIIGAPSPLDLLPSLTTLSLVHLGAFSISTMDDFLDLLSRAPKLETVSWSLLPGGMIHAAGPTVPSKHVHLSSLKSIVVENLSSMMRYEPRDVSPFPIRLLQHLSFPPSCEVSIHAMYPSDFAPTVRILGLERRATHLRVRYNTRRTAIYVDAVDTVTQHAHKVSLCVTVGGRMKPDTGDARVTDLGMRIAGLALFTNIRFLWVQYRIRSEVERLFDPEHSILRGLPRLESLLLSNRPPRTTDCTVAHTPICELVSMFEAGSVSTDGALLNPALSLHVFEIWQKEKWEDGCVRRLIESRARSGCPLTKVLVEQWSISIDLTLTAASTVREYDGEGAVVQVYTVDGTGAYEVAKGAWTAGDLHVLDLFPSMFDLYETKRA
ncbi:hypothetical protein C8Q80DRAFT_1174066 [Daedaleopsis nitida]|nr:hypothetical protein C8Q80DRAFT_1174066 [Daedaleopsis nitida]